MMFGKVAAFFGILIMVKLSVIYYISGGNWTFMVQPIYKWSHNYTKTTFLRNFSEQHVKVLSKTVNKNWFMLPDKMNRLNENIIYEKFHIQESTVRQKFNVIMIVSSAPARYDRREVIRQTWWRDCETSARVSILCVFLTDQKKKDTELGKKLWEEQSKYKDLFFQELEGGHDFGKRFLYHLVWAMQKIQFDYFMRIDDDYFLCMDRFVKEIPMPPRSMYHWGWVHCVENIVRPEESIILLSRDIIERFLGQDPEKMLCHRWADQMIGVWNEELKLPKFYHHDSRLHHHPPAQFLEKFKHEKNICQQYIGVHGAYPPQMKTLWVNRGPPHYPQRIMKTLWVNHGPPHYPQGVTFDNYASECHLPSVMKWNLFGAPWTAEPKLCKTNPDWGGSHGTTYIGRQGH